MGKYLKNGYFKSISFPLDAFVDPKQAALFNEKTFETEMGPVLKNFPPVQPPPANNDGAAD